VDQARELDLQRSAATGSELGGVYLPLLSADEGLPIIRDPSTAHHAGHREPGKHIAQSAIGQGGQISGFNGCPLINR
jgi:hypothetical protein